jgi:hypothetical protein
VGLRQWLAVVGAVAARPRLWPEAIGQMTRLARTGWWRYRPFLPVPGGDDLEFRLLTQYGDEHHPPAPADVVDYLAWCARVRP